MPATTSHSVTNMSTETKKTTKKTVVAAAPAPAPAVVDPVAPKTARKTAAKTEVTVPVVAEAPAPAPVAAPVAAPATEAVVAPTLTQVVDHLRDVQSRLAAELKSIIRDTLLAAKTAAREVKDARRKRRVRKDPAEMTEEERVAYEARRAKNAFLKPRALSPELCSFMGLSAGSQRSQTDVTKFVSNYVKTHSCFDPANKRRIIPDSALSRLLKVSDKDTVTYLNLQSYLKVHFLKA
jgi:SWIB/MDM2 domain